LVCGFSRAILRNSTNSKQFLQIAIDVGKKVPGRGCREVTKDLYFSWYHSGPIEVSGKISFLISIK
jgi:hypothetical protein